MILGVQVQKILVRRCSFSCTGSGFWRIDVAAWRRFPHWDSQLLVAQLEGNSEARSDKSMSKCDDSVLSKDITYRSDVFFVELRPNDCGLDEVFDICYAWEPA